MEATFALDESIGLKPRGKYALTELYPLEKRLIGKPGAGVWSYGDTVTREMDGGSAMVIGIEPAEPSRSATLFNAPGSGEIEGGVLRLTGVLGEAGAKENLLVSSPNSAKVKSVLVNGQRDACSRAGPEASSRFPSPSPESLSATISRSTPYNPAFTGGAVTAPFRIPQRIFDQLDARRKAWPIPWTPEDYRSTWLVPERLLLYVQLAEPDDRWTASLQIDGRPVELHKAYASVRANRRNFVGFYADVSALAPGQEHQLQLELPRSLQPGQFQGVFFENVETEYTSKIAAAFVAKIRPMRTHFLIPALAIASLLAETRQAVPTRYYRTFSHTNPVFLRINPGDIVVTKTLDSGGQDYRGEH